jgi:hypothetical protein
VLLHMVEQPGQLPSNSLSLGLHVMSRNVHRIAQGVEAKIAVNSALMQRSLPGLVVRCMTLQGM